MQASDAASAARDAAALHATDDPALRSAALKRRAAGLGLFRCGIARAEPLAEDLARHRAACDAGYTGELRYLRNAPERRYDPAAVLEGARSVIVVAMAYGAGARTPESGAAAGRGKLSRYAWGGDYHRILAEPLAELRRCVAALQPGARTRSYVDSGPVAEKAWAQRAGIGWRGKHGLIVTREAGSMLFLGVLLTDAEFEYDEPIPDTCGSCTRCLEACPTGALVAPRVLDASRCISHATVESRAAGVPGVTDGALNGWLYGCDDCQDACPWNGAARQEADGRFLPRDGETDLDLAAVLAMDGDGFRRRFSDSPILRAKLERLQRNARWLMERQFRDGRP